MGRDTTIRFCPDTGDGDCNAILHDRRQMPVGQGGFHVGALATLDVLDLMGFSPEGVERFQRANFIYAYDCGSEPKRHVHREINALLYQRPDRNLDVLVLSHFDRDHICGTPHLLNAKTGFKVGTIILPYVDEAERIVALARAAATTEGQGGVIDSFFTGMVFDPVGTLSAFGPDRIVFVRAASDDGPLSSTVGPEGDPEGGSEFEPDLDFDPDRKMRGFKLALRADDPTRILEKKVTRARAGASTVVLEVRNAALSAYDPVSGIAWKLRPHVRAASPAVLAKFRKEVETRLKWKTGSFSHMIAQPAVRKQMVTTKRTKLAAAYREAFKDKNLTSLSLYSGPCAPHTLDAICVSDDLEPNALTKVGWLGTGDAHLRESGDIDTFERHYGADIALTSTFVFPHHGSIENSDPGRLVTDADQWVAAADPIHKWEHPHWKLQGAVEDREANFHHVKASVFTAFDECFLVARRDPHLFDCWVVAGGNGQLMWSWKSPQAS